MMIFQLTVIEMSLHQVTVTKTNTCLFGLRYNDDDDDDT